MRVEISKDDGLTWELERNTSFLIYTDTGLQPDTNYRYRVFARNTIGRSPASNVVIVRTAKKPEAPTNLRATASGTNRINLSWSAPSDRGTASITGYKVDVSLSGLGGWSEVVASTNRSSPSYSATGLEPATTYHYRVFAITSVGRSTLASDTASATTNNTSQVSGVFEEFRIVSAGVNGAHESDTSRLITSSGAPLILEVGTGIIDPVVFDGYQNADAPDKDQYLRDTRIGIAVKLATNITRVQTLITFNYPRYPVNGDVTVVYENDVSRSYHSVCGLDGDRTATKHDTYGRNDPWEATDYAACPMLRNNGPVTIVLRAYDDGILLKTVMLKLQVSNWQ